MCLILTKYIVVQLCLSLLPKTNYNALKVVKTVENLHIFTELGFLENLKTAGIIIQFFYIRVF